jgi:predicted PhzF superfamily epimerase YddE/YHI9
MRIPYFRVSAFASNPFAGNPAGVCPLDRWLPDDLLQRIAAENNLSETAYFVQEKNSYHLRWFTPAVEVDLCGHATLASAFVLFTELGFKQPIVRFRTRSGLLSAARNQDLLDLDFPSRPPKPCAAPDVLIKGLGAEPREVLKSRDYFAVFDSAREVADLDPDFHLLGQVESLGIIVTARDETVDFVSRFFAPRAGINEDPVTGSAHCTLIPYWAQRLKKTELRAHQISQRGGELFCRLDGDRVAIGGRAAIYSRGSLELPES